MMIKEIFGGKIGIEMKDQKLETHYEITPYSFNPKIGRKYISYYYLDLGQGLLQCVDELYKKFDKAKQAMNG